MSLRRVTVFGGSGFVGRHVVQRLARRGVIVTMEHVQRIMDEEGI